MNKGELLIKIKELKQAETYRLEHIDKLHQDNATLQQVILEMKEGKETLSLVSKMQMEIDRIKQRRNVERLDHVIKDYLSHCKAYPTVPITLEYLKTLAQRLNEEIIGGDDE